MLVKSSRDHHGYEILVFVQSNIWIAVYNKQQNHMLSIQMYFSMNIYF